MKSLFRFGCFLVIVVSLLGFTIACDNLFGSDDDNGNITDNTGENGDENGTNGPSTDATLYSLSVSEGLLIPAFDPQTHEYSVTVLSSIAKITIDASTLDENASLCANAGTLQDLEDGANSITITVSAQDETTTNVYVITVMRDDYQIRNPGPAGGMIFYVDSDNEHEWSYLEAAPEDIEIDGIADWNWGGREYKVGIPAQGRLIGDGKANTEAIAEFFDSLYLKSDSEISYYDFDWETLTTNNDKARFTSDGDNDYWFRWENDGTVAGKLSMQHSVIHEGATFEDWFLPSIDELSAMYENLHESPAVGGFLDLAYWSSSELDNLSASILIFGNGEEEVGAKGTRNGGGRPIRAVRAF